MNGSRIFINYRREDTSGESGRLFDHLVDRYGASRVFRDIDRSIPGAPFPDAVDSAVRGSSVVLVVIGRRWLEELRARATRSDDYVLMEIRTALEQNVRIIPVLIDSTPMPKPDLLPQDIRQLSLIEALDVSQSRWDYDMSRLFSILDGVVGHGGLPVPVSSPAARSAVKVTGTACVVVMLVAAAAAIVGGIFLVRTFGPIVTGTASISLSPDNGTGGTNLTVVGHGYAPGETVEIYFQGQPVGTVTASGDGSFQTQIVVPNSFSVFHGDSLTVSAAGKTSAKSADAQFTIR